MNYTYCGKSWQNMMKDIDIQTGYGFKGSNKFAGNGTVGYSPDGRKATKKRSKKRKRR